MKRVLIAAALLLTVTFVLTGFAVADPLKSGPQVGQEVPGPFHPLNVTGDKAGQKNCLYCQNGSNPVAMIFAREVSAPPMPPPPTKPYEQPLEICRPPYHPQ